VYIDEDWLRRETPFTISNLDIAMGLEEELVDGVADLGR
jgi:hypothetical protein